jgi:hypothetical protein
LAISRSGTANQCGLRLGSPCPMSIAAREKFMKIPL